MPAPNVPTHLVRALNLLVPMALGAVAVGAVPDGRAFPDPHGARRSTRHQFLSTTRRQVCRARLRGGLDRIRPPPRSCRTPPPDKSAEAIDEWAPRSLLSVERIGRGEGTAHRSIGGDCERSRGRTVVRTKDGTLEAPVRIAVGSRVPIQRSAVRRPPSKASSVYRWRSSGRAGPPRSFLESLPGARRVPSIRSRGSGSSPLPSS